MRAPRSPAGLTKRVRWPGCRPQVLDPRVLSPQTSKHRPRALSLRFHASGRRPPPSQQVYTNAGQCEENDHQSSLDNRSNQEFHPARDPEQAMQHKGTDECSPNGVHQPRGPHGIGRNPDLTVDDRGGNRPNQETRNKRRQTFRRVRRDGPEIREMPSPPYQPYKYVGRENGARSSGG